MLPMPLEAMRSGPPRRFVQAISSGTVLAGILPLMARPEPFSTTRVTGTKAVRTS